MKEEILRLRIEKELQEKLKRLAAKNALSVSAQVRMMIKQAEE